MSGRELWKAGMDQVGLDSHSWWGGFSTSGTVEGRYKKGEVV